MFPAETTASARPSATAMWAATSEESGLRANGLRRLLVHLDQLRRLDERETVGVEPGRPEQGHVDPVGGCVERAEDDGVRSPVAPHRIDCDAGQGYGAGVRSGSISRPLYVWHVGQTR